MEAAHWVVACLLQGRIPPVQLAPSNRRLPIRNARRTEEQNKRSPNQHEVWADFARLKLLKLPHDYYSLATATATVARGALCSRAAAAGPVVGCGNSIGVEYADRPTTEI